MKKLLLTVAVLGLASSALARIHYSISTRYNQFSDRNGYSIGGRVVDDGFYIDLGVHNGRSRSCKSRYNKSRHTPVHVKTTHRKHYDTDLHRVVYVPTYDASSVHRSTHREYYDTTLHKVVYVPINDTPNTHGCSHGTKYKTSKTYDGKLYKKYY